LSERIKTRSASLGSVKVLSIQLLKN